MSLPAIVPNREVVALGNGRTHIRNPGEPLHGARESLEVLAQVKRAIGSTRFSAHYQQEPLPAEGNTLLRSWFKLVDRLPERAAGVRVIQSWDIAIGTGDANDYSTCITAFVVRGDYHIAHVWRGRLAFPDLRRKVIGLAQEYRADAVLIEDAGAGMQLIQDLVANRPADMIRPIGRKPVGSKEERVAGQSVKIEAGHVHLPKSAPWLDEFLDEVLAFPNGRNDDQVDALTQLLAWAFDRRLTWGVTGLEHALVLN